MTGAACQMQAHLQARAPLHVVHQQRPDRRAVVGQVAGQVVVAVVGQ